MSYFQLTEKLKRFRYRFLRQWLLKTDNKRLQMALWDLKLEWPESGITVKKQLTVIDMMQCYKSISNYFDSTKYLPIAKYWSNFVATSVFSMLSRISFIVCIPASLPKRFFLSRTFFKSLPVRISTNNFPKNKSLYYKSYVLLTHKVL